jgi:hypothetical protein
MRVRARHVLAREHAVRAAAEPRPDDRELDDQHRDRGCPRGDHARGRQLRRRRGRYQQDGSEDRLGYVQPAEDQAADAQADPHGDPGRPELQRRLEERDGDDHAEPREDRGGRGGAGGGHEDALSTRYSLYSF